MTTNGDTHAAFVTWLNILPAKACDLAADQLIAMAFRFLSLLFLAALLFLCSDQMSAQKPAPAKARKPRHYCNGYRHSGVVAGPAARGTTADMTLL